MNHTEWTLPRSARTVDRETVSPGWAGWHYRRPVLHKLWDKAAQVLFVVAMFGGLAGLLAWGGRAWP